MKISENTDFVTKDTIPLDTLEFVVRVAVVAECIRLVNQNRMITGVAVRLYNYKDEIIANGTVSLVTCLRFYKAHRQIVDDTIKSQ